MLQSYRMNIHISNIDYNIIEADLQRIFKPFGEIGSVEILRDKLNNRPRGRAVVEMPIEREAQNDIEYLNGQILGRKRILVSRVQ